MRRAVDPSGADVTTALVALLNSTAAEQLYSVELLDIVLKTIGWPRVDGTGLHLRLALGDVNVQWGADVYTAGGPLVHRGTRRDVIGIEVGTLDLTLLPMVTDVLPAADGQPGTYQFTWFEAAAEKLFEDATVTLRRVFQARPPQFGANLDTSVGAVTLFGGRVREWSVDRKAIALKVRSFLDYFNQKLPRNIFQPGCANTLYDTICGAQPTDVVNGHALLADTSVLTSGADRTSFTFSGVPQPTGFFDLGTVEFRSGALAGLRAPIKNYNQGLRTVTLLQKLPRAAEGNVRLQAGCDKTVSTCTAKFGRYPSGFRGFPYIPPADNAY